MTFFYARKPLDTRLFRISAFEISIGVLKTPSFFNVKAFLFTPFFTLDNYTDTFLPDRCIFKAGHTDLHKKYNFITYLLAYINIKHPGGGYNLDGKIKATNFVQKKRRNIRLQTLSHNPW